MRKLPPLSQLRAFESAARHLSFKNAASELAVTPTAISHQIKLLEQFCGLSLFHRRPRPMSLSEAGIRLLPVVRDGLDAFADTLSEIREHPDHSLLRVTTTKAFASRWLVPKLSLWQSEHPDIPLEIIGTDTVLDLKTGECDMAIRYQKSAPQNMLVQELFRDTFVAVCKPALLPGGRPLRDLVGLAQLTLIHWYWSPQEMHPPTWRWWLQHVQDQYTSVPNIDELRQVTFREELHAIEAVINGQGIALFSDHLILNELQSGVLIKAMEPSLPGLSCYIVSQPDHPRKNIIEMFSSWLCSFV